MSETTQIAATIVVSAILIQFCVERIKEIVGERIMGYIKAPVWSLVLGVIFALLFSIDLFALIGFTSSSSIISQIITGIVLSSGSAPVHELFAKIRESRNFNF